MAAAAAAPFTTLPKVAGQRRNKLNKILRLEQSWDSNVSFQREPKRHLQMSMDIKNFIVKSVSVDTQQPERDEIIQSRKNAREGMFEKISQTLNFSHHEGTDPKLELKVLKIIMMREGLLSNLQYLSERTLATDNLESLCSSILEVLAQIRESTLNYLEALCLWRQSVDGAMTMSPRVFFWEGKNYTIKIVSDLDFLSENPLITNALEISAAQFVSNPLMLTNNLDDPNTWMDPVERAAFDADSKTDGAVFEARLRLRFAERILLQEIELTSAPEMDDPASDVFLTQQGSIALPPQQQKQQRMGLERGSSALESDTFDDERDGYAEDFNDLSAKSAWGVNNDDYENEGEEEGQFDRALNGSADSNAAINPSVPNSRSSTLTGGFGSNSGPNSAFGDRARSRGRSQPTTAASATGGGGGSPYFDVSSDFFSGNWDNGTSSYAYPQQMQQQQGIAADSNGANGMEMRPSSGQDDIYFEDDGHPMDGPKGSGRASTPGAAADANELLLQQQQQQQLSDTASLGDVISLGTAKSAETVRTMELHVISNVAVPPRNLMLAAAVCVIALSDSTGLPRDVSWPAFVRLSNRINLAEAMAAVDPAKIPKFKIIAIKPLLEQLLVNDGAYYEHMQNNELPFQEFIAINKLIAWAKQFSTSAIRKFMQQQEKLRKKKRRQQQTESGGSESDSPGKYSSSRSPTKNIDSSVSPAAAAAIASGDIKPKQLKPLHPPAATAAVENVSRRPSSDERSPRPQLSSRGNNSNSGGVHASRSEQSLDSLPLSRNSIPKMSSDLFPVHTEMVQDLYKHPIMIAVLTTDESKANLSTAAKEALKADRLTGTTTGNNTVAVAGNSSDGAATSAALQQVNPETKRSHLEHPGAYQLQYPMSIKHQQQQAGEERLVLKVYDVIESAEAYLNINKREYSLIQTELDAAHNNMAAKYFKPDDPKWWAKHLKKLLVVTARAHGKISIAVSRKAIEKVVTDAIRKRDHAVLHALDVSPAKSRQQQQQRKRSSQLRTSKEMRASQGSSGNNNSSSKNNSSNSRLQKAAAHAQKVAAAADSDSDAAAAEKKHAKPPQKQQRSRAVVATATPIASATAASARNKNTTSPAGRKATAAPGVATTATTAAATKKKILTPPPAIAAVQKSKTAVAVAATVVCSSNPITAAVSPNKSEEPAQAAATPATVVVAAATSSIIAAASPAVVSVEAAVTDKADVSTAEVAVKAAAETGPPAETVATPSATAAAVEEVVVATDVSSPLRATGVAVTSAIELDMDDNADDYEADFEQETPAATGKKPPLKTPQQQQQQRPLSAPVAEEVDVVDAVETPLGSEQYTPLGSSGQFTPLGRDTTPNAAATATTPTAVAAAAVVMTADSPTNSSRAGLGSLIGEGTEKSQAQMFEASNDSSSFFSLPDGIVQAAARKKSFLDADLTPGKKAAIVGSLNATAAAVTNASSSAPSATAVVGKEVATGKETAAAAVVIQDLPSVVYEGAVGQEESHVLQVSAEPSELGNSLYGDDFDEASAAVVGGSSSNKIATTEAAVVVVAPSSVVNDTSAAGALKGKGVAEETTINGTADVTTPPVTAALNSEAASVQMLDELSGSFEEEPDSIQQQQQQQQQQMSKIEQEQAELNEMCDESALFDSVEDEF